MTRPEDHKTNPARGRDTDTSSYEQLQGAPDPQHDSNRRNEKLPHERDESARSTGNRLDQKVPPSEGRISQAHDDADAGQVDTDRRGVPNDVPSGKR